MDTNKRSYVLEHLLQCRQCGSPMLVSLGQDPNADVYSCSRSNTSQDRTCATPDVRAYRFETWLIHELTDAIMTPRNLQFLQQSLAASSGQVLRPDPNTTAELARDPLTYNATDVRQLAKRTFSKLIQKITLQGTTAVIHYSIPLPADSSLPGEHLQTVDMPAEIII